MSHFAVVVIGDDVAGQLDKYDENKEMPPTKDPDREYESSWKEALKHYEEVAQKDPEELAQWSANHSFAGGLGRIFGGKEPEDKPIQEIHREQARSEINEAKQCVRALKEGTPVEKMEALRRWDGQWKIINDEITPVTTYNPDSKWDWWQVGGRWNGYFDLRPDAEAPLPEPHYSEIQAEQDKFGLRTYENHVKMASEAGLPVSTEEEWNAAQERNRAPYATREDFYRAKRGTSDQCRIGDVDFEFARNKARIQAEERYDAYIKATVGLEIPPSWKEFIESKGGFDKVNIAEAREEFSAIRDDPWNKAINKLHDGHFWGDAHDYYCVRAKDPRQAMIDRAVNGVFVPYAIVQDGVWYAKGDMGWWGMSSNDMDEGQWNAKVAELYASLAPDTQVTAVDCHI